MKRTLLTMLILVFFCIPTSASMVIIDYQGDTSVYPQSVERSLIVNSDDGRTYNVAIRPLEDALRSTDGKVSIPLENLYINNTREDVYLKYNEFSNIYDSSTMGSMPVIMTAKIRDFGVVPAGTYSINFEVQATSLETQQITSSTFNLQFVVNSSQEINLYNEVPKIVISADNAFNKTQKAINETSPMIYINSNSDWELALNADNFGDSVGNYYIRTVSASSNVGERLIERVLIQPGNEIVIAKGKAPANNEFVSVEYSLESKDGKFIPAGNYENRVKYILREGN